MKRSIKQVIQAIPTSDGAGVNLSRSLGTQLLPQLDPFLMLDEFKSDDAADYIAGFPSHPHRGFETVTYMLAGSMEHKDNKGNVGKLSAGDAQWMTAARGIIHSEMPQQENGLMWGFQLWVNLPAKNKMDEARYQDISSAQIPEIELGEGNRIRVIAGESLGVVGAIQGIATAPLFLDIHLTPNQEFQQAIPKGQNAFLYIYKGEAQFGLGEEEGGGKIEAQHLAVLSDGEEINIKTSDSEVQFLLLAGTPIHEPVARHGPFVMNTQEEIQKAFTDYHSGAFTG